MPCVGKVPPNRPGQRIMSVLCLNILVGVPATIGPCSVLQEKRQDESRELRRVKLSEVTIRHQKHPGQVRMWWSEMTTGH